MKKSLMFAACALSAALLPGCASFEPTRNLSDALAHVETDIEYHDREYMESRPMYVPIINDVNDLGGLKFNFAIEDGHNGSATASNRLTKNEMAAFKREFENAIAGSCRFPIAQIQFGLADKELRKDAFDGVSRTKDLDVSEMEEAEGIIHITPFITTSESSVKREKTITSTYTLTCNPLKAVNNAPMAEIQPFSLNVQSKILQKTDKMGRCVAGFRFNTPAQQEDFHIRQGRAAIVRFFTKMYAMFPVGGAVTNFDGDGQALFKANRSTGLQPNMECVIFAVERDFEDAIPVALYNATATTVGQTGNSTLTIWRENKSSKNAKKIINMIEEDIAAARESYEFYACADGFAQWPDFIDHVNIQE